MTDNETRPLYGYLTLQGPAKTIQRFCTAYPDWTAAPLGADRPNSQGLISIAGIMAEFGPYAWEGSDDELLTEWTAISRKWPTLWFRWELFVWHSEVFPEDEDPDVDAAPGYLCTVWLHRGRVESQTYVGNSEAVRAFIWMTRGLVERDLAAPDEEPWDWSEPTFEEQRETAMNAIEAAWAAEEAEVAVQTAWREAAQARLADPHEVIQAQIDALETRTEPEEWIDDPAFDADEWDEDPIFEEWIDDPACDAENELHSLNLEVTSEDDGHIIDDLWSEDLPF